MLVVIARYVVRDGEEEEVARLLAANADASRKEAGCLEFSVFRDTTDPRRFLLYEAYVDEDAFQSHRRTAHFRELIEQRVAPRLVERRWSRLEQLPSEDDT